MNQRGRQEFVTPQESLNNNQRREIGSGELTRSKGISKNDEKILHMRRRRQALGTKMNAVLDSYPK